VGYNIVEESGWARDIGNNSRLFFQPKWNMQRKLMKNVMGFKHKLGRGVYLLEPGAEVIYSADIPPDR
jgi:hypothetical protein